jgi:eukaryotic-like serine/threonine-protein kinase
LASTPLWKSDPAQVGSYRLIGRLGSGGMGVVYLASAPDGGQVAVKLLRPELADNTEFRTRFAREVAALTRIHGVCTVRVIEADTTSARPFLVTEYVDGPSLAEYVSAHGPLDAQMLYGLATGLAEALTAIHATAIVHRDLKPSNVLLTQAGPKVIDFGIAQALDATALTSTGITVGSAGFMAPEQVTGRAGTPADIFSWALTIAYAASGQQPFGTGTSDVILYRILHGAPDVAAVPDSLRPQVTAALARDPAARPSAAELLSQLTGTRTQASAGYDVPTQTILAQTWRPPERAPSAAAVAAADRAPRSGAARPATRPQAPAAKRTGLRRPVLVAIVLALAIAAGATGAALALTGGTATGHGPGTGSTATRGQTVAPTVNNNSGFSASPTPGSSVSPTSSGSGTASTSTGSTSTSTGTGSTSTSTSTSGTSTSGTGGTSTSGTGGTSTSGTGGAGGTSTSTSTSGTGGGNTSTSNSTP